MKAFCTRILALASSALLFWSCATEPSSKHPMGGAIAGQALWVADLPSMPEASRQAGLLDSLGPEYLDLKILHSALTAWPEGRALLSMHRRGEMGSAWMLTAPRGSWAPSSLRQPYEVRSYNGTSLYEGDGWAAAASDDVLWVATIDLLVEEVLRRKQNPIRPDSASQALLEMLPDGGIAVGPEAAARYGSPSALTFEWKGNRSLRSSEVRYPDSLAMDLKSGGPVLLPNVDSSTVAVSGNSVVFNDEARKIATQGSGQGTWKTFVRRQPLIMATWQTWSDSSNFLPFWTPLALVSDRWTSPYPHYAYTKSYGLTWVSTDDSLRFERSVALELQAIDLEGEFIQADLQRGLGGDLWMLRKDDGKKASWTLTWKPWSPTNAPALQEDEESAAKQE